MKTDGKLKNPDETLACFIKKTNRIFCLSGILSSRVMFMTHFSVTFCSIAFCQVTPHLTMYFRHYIKSISSSHPPKMAHTRNTVDDQKVQNFLAIPLRTPLYTTASSPRSHGTRFASFHFHQSHNFPYFNHSRNWYSMFLKMQQL